MLNFPTDAVQLTYTLYHAAEDTDTRALIERVQTREREHPSGITWQWRVLPREKLFRRAIGRHEAALQTRADWVWFTDCDLIFHDNCLPSLAAALDGRQAKLVYPAGEHITAELLPPEHAWLHRGSPEDLPVDIDPGLFVDNAINKAKGAFQIVHGEVCRQCGYCGDIALYQRPTRHWRKTFEDTAFRNLIGDQGTPVPIDGIYRIRHESKGRYVADSGFSGVRQKIRRMSDAR